MGIVFVVAIWICYLTTFLNASKDSAFLEWFRDNGGELDGVTIDQFDNMGRGILVEQNTVEGKRVIYVPSSIIFSQKNLEHRSKQDTALKQIISAFPRDSEAAVTAWLILELKRGEQSFFKPYIDVLPSYVPSLIYFSPEELGDLQSPELSADAQNLQIEVTKDFNNFQKSLSSHWPINIRSTTLDDFKWAVSIVSSRGLRFRGDVYMSPVADMFNYAPQKALRESGSGESFLKYHILGSDGSITVLADRAADSGEQLFEDYGDNNDDLYMKYHGFVAIGNPFTCVKVDAAKVQRILLPLSPVQSKLLRLFEIRMDSTSFKCIDRGAQLGKAMEIYVAIIAFDNAAANHCVSVIENNPRAWSKILEDCSINSIAEYIYNWKNLSQPSDRNEVGDRALAALRNIFSVGMAPLMATHPSFDRNLLQQLQQSLEDCKNESLNSPQKSDSVCISDDSKRTVVRKILAVQYRLQKKELWMSLCERFGHKNCFPEISMEETTSKETIADKEITELKQKIEAFNSWFLASKPSAASIVASYFPGFRVGTVAVEDVRVGKPYLGVPATIILDSDTAYKNSSVSPLITQLVKKYNTRDDFHELLLFLVHETFISGPSSSYWPYLFLLPKLTELDIPVLWNNKTLTNRLGPSHLLKEVIRYKEKLRRRFKAFKEISPIKEHFPLGLFTWDVYLWASIVLDSRSIWWNGKRHLVPMLDFVNCAENPSEPSRVHSTNLDESERYAVTKGGRIYTNFRNPLLVNCHNGLLRSKL